MCTRTRWLATLLIAGVAASLTAQENDGHLIMLDSAASILELPGPRSLPAPKGELVKQRYPNGAIHIERWVTETADGDFVNHGAYTEYDPAGQVARSGDYENGLRHGSWSQLITADEIKQLVGQLGGSFKAPFFSKVDFAQGQMSGNWTCSDADGKPVFVWGFKEGARSGLSSWFDGSGEIIRAVTYRDNLAHGPAKVIVTKDGKPEDIQFEEGRMRHHVEQWYPASKGSKRTLKSQDWYLVPTPLNLAAHDWEANRVEHQNVNEEDRIRHGLSVSYYPNGNRQAQGEYNYGKRTGTFSWWYSNGQERTVGAFEDDVEQGEWTWYHENGMKEARGNYNAGEKIATWSVWDPTGKLVQRANTDTRRLAIRKLEVDER